MVWDSGLPFSYKKWHSGATFDDGGNEDCPCKDSIEHLSLFKNIKKRNNSESSSYSAKKLCQNSPMPNSLSPPSDFSPTSNLDGNISPNNIIQDGGEKKKDYFNFSISNGLLYIWTELLSNFFW